MTIVSGGGEIHAFHYAARLLLQAASFSNHPTTELHIPVQSRKQPQIDPTQNRGTQINKQTNAKSLLDRLTGAVVFTLDGNSS